MRKKKAFRKLFLSSKAVEAFCGLEGRPRTRNTKKRVPARMIYRQRVCVCVCVCLTFTAPSLLIGRICSQIGVGKRAILTSPVDKLEHRLSFYFDVLKFSPEELRALVRVNLVR